MTSAHHAPAAARTAAILIIGNEVLSGKVEDINSRFLLKELYRLGVRVERVVVIPDVIDVIAHEVREASARYDYVFTSGGIGPTHDDLTMPGVALAFGIGLEEHPVLSTLVREHFRERLTDAARRLAMLPRDAQLLNEGCLRDQVVMVRNVFVFPGVPDMLRNKFEAIKERFRDSPYYLSQIFTLEGESVLAEHLEATLALFPGVEIGSYPRFDISEYRVELTLECKDSRLLAQARDYLLGCVTPEKVVRVVGP